MYGYGCDIHVIVTQHVPDLPPAACRVSLREASALHAIMLVWFVTTVTCLSLVCDDCKMSSMLCCGVLICSSSSVGMCSCVLAIAQ